MFYRIHLSGLAHSLAHSVAFVALLSVPLIAAPLTLAGGIAMSALLALGAFATPASADWDNDQGDYHHNWNGGYYHAPPVSTVRPTAMVTTVRRPSFTPRASASICRV